MDRSLPRHRGEGDLARARLGCPIHEPNDVEREHSVAIRNNGGQTSGSLRASWQGSKSVLRVVDGVGSDLGGLEAGLTRGIVLTYVKSPPGTYQARLVIPAAPGGSITVLLKLVISGLVLPISSKGTPGANF